MQRARKEVNVGAERKLYARARPQLLPEPKAANDSDNKLLNKQPVICVFLVVVVVGFSFGFGFGGSSNLQKDNSRRRANTCTCYPACWGQQKRAQLIGGGGDFPAR